MARLDSRIMEEKLKIGWTTADFSTHFNISEEQFVNALKRTFSTDTSQKYVSRLEKNQKRFLKNKKQLQNRQSTDNLEVTSAVTPSTEVSVADNETDSNLQAMQKLEELKAYEKDLAEHICEIEITRKEILFRRRSLHKELSTEKDEMLKLREKIEQHKGKVTSIIEELDTISQELTDVNFDLCTYRNSIDDVRLQIKCLSKISIFAYESGEIEYEADIEIPDYSQTFSELTSNIAVENLTIKQIKQLAKLLNLTRLLQQQSISFEVICDAAELQSAFEQLFQ